MVFYRPTGKIIGTYDRALYDDKFFYDDQYRKTGSYRNFLLVPCGKCPECRRAKALEWGYRCADELVQCDGKGVFITLTYDNRYLKSPNLNKDDFQRFMKRLRRRVEPRKLRYFAAGEYGDLRSRPHFHLILFGEDFREYWRRFFFKDDHWVYQCDFLGEIWGKGFVSVEDVTLQNCMYIVSYLRDFALPPGVTVKPFNLMSRKPAIGCRRLKPDDDISDDKLYVNGGYIKLPRSYLTRYERLGKNLDELRQKRVDNSLVCSETQNDLCIRRSAALDKFKPR